MELRSAPGQEQRGPATGILVVGSGSVAAEHLAAARVCADRCEVMGIVDIDARRAADMSRANGGVPWTTRLDEALTWPDVDACILTTPNATHHDIGLRVAAAGKHLLVEKPLATAVADAVDMTAAFRRAGLVLTTAHTHRSYDYARAVKTAIDRGDVGQPVALRLAILGGWIWPDWRSWVLDPKVSGGHALHNGVHLLDLANWWLDAEPESVYARGQRQTASQLDIYDHLEMTVQYADSAVAICEMSRAHRTGRLNQRDVLVVGSDGVLTMSWDGDASYVLAEDGVSLLPSTGQSGFVVQLNTWLDAVQGSRSTLQADDAVTAVAMAVAAERSIQLARPVSLSETWPHLGSTEGAAFA